MLKAEKERIVAELAERLKRTQTLFVADYRGLSVTEIDDLRAKLIEHGARFTVVKNTLTRRAAQEAGAEALLAMLEGPTAIAFIEADGDMVAVAKALADSARTTRVLAIRGGILDGAPIGEEDVRNLATLPPLDILRGQVLSAVTAPLMTVVGLISAPLRDLVALIDARIEQLEDSARAEAASPGGDADGSGPTTVEGTDAAATEPEPVAAASAEAAGETETGEEPTEPDTAASSEPAAQSGTTEEPIEPASAQAEPERKESEEE